MYTYNAIVKRWVDGNTIELNVNLGFRTWLIKEKFRLIGVNTPERGRDGFDESVKFVNDWAPPGTILLILVTKEGKYGRWLVRLWNTTLVDKDGNPDPRGKNIIIDKEGCSINDLLIAKGWMEGGNR